MSANRTRLLFADDTDLKSVVLGRPEFDVQVAGSTDEALRLSSASALPGAIVLPAMGATVDGVQVCRAVKATPQGRSIPVLLVLPADMSAKRDGCFAAGADDVIFTPLDAADIASRLDRNAAPFRNAPRATVDLVLRLASPTGNAVVDAQATQISREAVQVILPGGISPPAPGILVRTVFTLYEGGTLQVWARVAAVNDPPRTVLRFVGLTDAERKAIDYFVDFYLKRAGVAAPAAKPGAAPASPAAEANGGPAATPPAQSAAELLSALDAETVPPKEQSALGIGEQIRFLAEATLDEIAEAASSLAAGRMNTPVPKGFDAQRLKGFLPRLAPAETSALRGTTMYNSLLNDLRGTSAARLRLFELTIAVRESAGRVDRTTTERICLEAINEAQQIHNGLESRFQELLKAGNTAAIRDLTPVKAGILSACVDLKNVLDREILGKDPASAPRGIAKAPSQVRYERLDPGAAAEKAAAKSDKPSRDKAMPAPSGGGGKRIFVVLLLVALAGGAVWSNRGRFVDTTPPFKPELIQFSSNGVRVWTSYTEPLTNTLTYVVDDSWKTASEASRNAAIDEMVKRAGSAKYVRVVDYRKRELAHRDL